MELKHAALVIVDISGYTQFLRQRNLTLLHAEEIITQLLEAVIDAAEYPLTLNKLEGDAAFLYALMEDDHEKVAKDILKQVQAFFPAFEQRAAELDQDTAYCNCDACSQISHLKLKAFVHHGEIVIKQIRQFEELAGEEVILIHRLLKNSVEADEYILMSSAFAKLAGDIPKFKKEKRTEKYGDDPAVEVEVFYPAPKIPPLVLHDYTPQKANMFGAQIKRLFSHSFGKNENFEHIPNEKVGFFAYFKEMMG
ncbi:MAG: DUF2652 domain-containing protein [Anaerolineae bacterium]|jgi:hypothetical protein|nr:DUF2652 domain-containing protein [Anaerolineae bacterium]MBT7991273.1 DUF2652 domain-containing protein [Anaerolineae bacterium]